mmetsp:Transcript_24023/g.56789  ORF Transcript_24023/g.56789 Transcript_24023/m.56789 type:complete len:555 (-) Transcript_24023:1080-2744(-)
MTDAMANDPADDDEHEHEHEHEQVPIFEDREKIQKERRTTITTLASIAVVVVVAAIVQHQQRSSVVVQRRLSNDRDGWVGNLESLPHNMLGSSTEQDTMREVFVDNLSGRIDEYADENQEIIFGLTVKDLKQTRRAQEERKNGRRARGSRRKSGSGKSSENVIILDGGPAFTARSSRKNSQKDSEAPSQSVSPSALSATNAPTSSEKSGKGKGKAKSSKESLAPNVSVQPSTEPSTTPQPSISSKKGKGKGKDNGKKSKKGKSSTIVSETLLGLGLPLGGITDFTADTEEEFNTLTAEFATNFVENEFGNTVADFETTVTVTDFIPAGRRLGERSRSLMPADSVIVYNQRLTYITTDPTLTSLELAVAPFEAEESRGAYVEVLNSSDDENLRMVTSASRVIVPGVSSAPSPIDDSVAPTIEPSITSAPSPSDDSVAPTIEPSESNAPSATSNAPSVTSSAEPSVSDALTSQNVPFEKCYEDFSLGVICNSVSCIDQGPNLTDPQACANRCFAAGKDLAALGSGENCKCCDECITCSGPAGSVYAVNNAPCEPRG